MAFGICEILWLKLLLQDLGVKHSQRRSCFVIIMLLAVLLIIWCNMIELNM